MEFFVHLCMFEQYHTNVFFYFLTIRFTLMYVTIWKKGSVATSITLRLWTLCAFSVWCFNYNYVLQIKFKFCIKNKWKRWPHNDMCTVNCNWSSELHLFFSIFYYIQAYLKLPTLFFCCLALWDANLKSLDYRTLISLIIYVLSFGLCSSGSWHKTELIALTYFITPPWWNCHHLC